MKKKIISTIIIVLLITSMLLVDFITITSNIIAYATENSGDNNVEFTAYFKDNEGNKTFNTEKTINSEDINLCISVEVKKQGYFNGTIELTNNNFKFKQTEVEKIAQITDNTITLNQINVGEKVEFEIGLKPNLENKISLNMLNGENEIKLKGTYTNSEEKQEEITKSQNVKIALTAPNLTEENINLNSEILTNKIYKINNENKRILQILIRSGLQENEYPIKETNIELETIQDFESIKVEDRGTIATNGKEESFETSQNENKINIKIENNEEEGKISYIKQGTDNFIITCIYNETTNLENKEIKIKSTIELYDNQNTKIEKEITTQITEEKDEIIGYEILSNQDIYKGKMYAQEEEIYNTTSKIDIRYPQIEKNITITEGNSNYTSTINEKTYSKKATTAYINSNIDKEKLLKVIGEQGELKIKNTEGEEIAKINKDTETTEEGKINIQYNENIDKLVFEINNAQNTGIIEIEHTKKIQTNNDKKEEIEKVNQLITNGTLQETNNIQAKQVSTNSNLIEPETKINMEINKQNLIAGQINENVQIQAILLTKGSKYDLYKNPKLEIEFPSEINNIAINSINISHEKELKYEKASIRINEEGKSVLSIEVTGEQTKHCEGDAIKGANLIIDCNLTLDALDKSKNENIILKYTNEKATQYSNNGVTTSEITYIVNQKEEKEEENSEEQESATPINQTAGPVIETSEKTEKTDPITIEKNTFVIDNTNNYIYEEQIQRYAIAVTNNTEETIKNITITDKIPEELTYCTITKNTGYNNYYTEQEGTENYTETIETLKAGETVELEYFVRVKEGTEGKTISTQAEAKIEGNETTYKSNTVENEIKDNKLQMDVFLISDPSQYYSADDRLVYTIRIKNTTTEELNNIKIIDTLPEGMTYSSSQFLQYDDEKKEYYETIGDEIQNENYDPSTRKVTWEIEKIEANKEIALKLETTLDKMERNRRRMQTI